MSLATPVLVLPQSVELVFSLVEKHLEENGFRIIDRDLKRPWDGFFVIEPAQAEFFAQQYFPGVDFESLRITDNLSPKILMVAPCCQHDLQTQMVKSPEPWSLLTKFGLIKERLGDLLTDSLRAQLLKLSGYRTDVIEFIASEHTPRNIMIRAVFTGAKADQIEIDKYRNMCEIWGVEPALAGRLNIID